MASPGWVLVICDHWSPKRETQVGAVTIELYPDRESGLAGAEAFLLREDEYSLCRFIHRTLDAGFPRDCIYNDNHYTMFLKYVTPEE